MTRKALVSTVAFIAVFILLFSMLNTFFQPVWVKWNGYNATYGFYEEPRNTIDTVFLGASVMGNGVNTPALYEEYGICAYNLGTQRQPMAASYYWLKEVLRLHGKSLQTVVLEASTFRHLPEESFFHVAVDPIRNPIIKYQAFREYFGYSVNDALMSVMPMYFYHTRWAGDMTSEDFEKHNFTPDAGSRGFHFEPRLYENVSQQRGVFVPLDEYHYAIEYVFLNEESFEYFEKIYQLCQKEGLNLLIIKAPAWNWDRNYSDLVQQVADEHQVQFLDYHLSPLIEEIGYEHAKDSFDGKHLNYFGATKLSHHLGKVLREQYGAKDVRGEKRYAFMEEQSQAFTELTEMRLALRAANEVTAYLDTAMQNDVTILLTVKDEAAYSLTPQQRETFASFGLYELSNLVYRNSYIGVMQGGNVLYEVRKPDEENKTPLVHRDRLPDGTRYELQSGSFNDGNLASIRISGKEEAHNMTGINIVVYSNRHSTVVDAVCFNTNVESIGKTPLPSIFDEADPEEEELAAQ